MQLKAPPNVRTMPLQIKEKLSVDDLANVLYETIAEPAARVYGKAEATTFYSWMGDDIQNFWRGIAQQVIEHSKEWEPNQGSCCILSEKEKARLRTLPRVL